MLFSLLTHGMTHRLRASESTWFIIQTYLGHVTVVCWHLVYSHFATRPPDVEYTKHRSTALPAIDHKGIVAGCPNPKSKGSYRDRPQEMRVFGYPPRQLCLRVQNGEGEAAPMEPLHQPGWNVVSQQEAPPFGGHKS